MQIRIVLEGNRMATRAGEAFVVDITGVVNNRKQAHKVIDSALDAMEVEKDG